MTTGTRCDAPGCQQFGNYMLELREFAHGERHFCDTSCLASWALQRLDAVNALGPEITPADPGDPRGQTRSAIIAALNHNAYAGQIILDPSGGVWDGQHRHMMMSAQQLENLVDQMLVLTHCDNCPLLAADSDAPT